MCGFGRLFGFNCNEIEEDLLSVGEIVVMFLGFVVYGGNVLLNIGLCGDV